MSQPQTPTSQQQPNQDETHDLVVEAALFSAGRPMPIEELTDQTGLTQHQVTDALLELREAYKGRRTALDIVKSGQKWALALRAEYAEQTRHIVPPEVPRHVVRTLALIAYHQPILQSDLKDLVGSKVYEHVGHLVDAGMIYKTPDGLTYRLSTTSDFPEYFGIPEDEPERIRTFLAEKVGIEPETGEEAVEQYEPEGDEIDEADEGSDEDQGNQGASRDSDEDPDEAAAETPDDIELEPVDEDAEVAPPVPTAPDA